jgi:hypothetical protein
VQGTSGLLFGQGMPFGDFFLECTARPNAGQRRGGHGGRSALQSPVSRPRRSPGKASPPAGPSAHTLSGSQRLSAQQKHSICCRDDLLGRLAAPQQGVRVVASDQSSLSTGNAVLQAGLFSRLGGAGGVGASQLAGTGAGSGMPTPSPVRAGMAMVLDTGYLSPPVAATNSSVSVKQASVPTGTFRLDS